MWRRRHAYMISGVHLYVCVRQEEVGLDVCRGNEGLGGGTHTSHDMISGVCMRVWERKGRGWVTGCLQQGQGGLGGVTHI